MPQPAHTANSVSVLLSTITLSPTEVSPALLTTSDLRAAGLGKRAVRVAIAAGLLVRVRTGLYLPGGCCDDVVRAATEGGRIACLSALVLHGVFVLQNKHLHLHFPSNARKRSPVKRNAVWHWTPLASAPRSGATSVGLVDALVQAISCQPPRAAVASLDSALHQGLIRVDDLDDIFARVPVRRRGLRSFVDGRAESGPESIVRLIALMLGFTVELQVDIPTVGRVDLVLDGWLVVECDSEAFHAGWESQKKDRRRDLALAALGMACLRPVAEDIMFNPDVVVEALRGMRHRRRGPAGA